MTCFGNENPSELSALADSFSVNTHNQITLTDQHESPAETYIPPADVRVSYTRTGRLIGRAASWLTQMNLTKRSGRHLGRLIEVERRTMQFGSETRPGQFHLTIGYSAPRPVISFEAQQDIPVLLPAVYREGFMPIAEAVVPVTFLEHGAALLPPGQLDSTYRFYFEDQLLSPSDNYPDSRAYEKLQLLKEHIRNNGRRVEDE